MKKAPLFTTVVSIAALLFIAGCKKEESTGTSASATTLKGQAKAEINLTTSGLENVPDGTKIIVLIDPNELLANPDTSKKSDSYRYTTTVSGGNYSINIPARNNGSKIKIIADEFEATFVIDNNNSYRKIYSAAEATITIYAGSTEFYDITFN